MNDRDHLFSWRPERNRSSRIGSRAVSPGRGRPRSGGSLRLLILTALLALTLLVTVSGTQGQEVGLPVGSEAPSAALEDLDGNPVDLLDYIGKGKPTLVEFWAFWCGQCRLLQPEMERVQAAFGDRLNVVAVAVAVSQTPDQVKGHIREHAPGYPYLYDREGNAVRGYKVPGTAVVLIFDEDGTVVYNGTGGGQDLVEAVEKILGS